jgi:glutathione S-transferase
MRIFHIATHDDWERALLSGHYTTSTLGVSLEQAGFLHAARREQVSSVLARYYGDVTVPLVLLEIETHLLDVPWREDDVAGETFPHVYGPLSLAAVVSAGPVDARV